MELHLLLSTFFGGERFLFVCLSGAFFDSFFLQREREREKQMVQSEKVEEKKSFF